MIKKIGIAILIGILSTYVILLSCNKVIKKAAENRTYWSVENIPKNRVGLVLGTSNRLVGGGPNP